jgi:hypothetical protein
LTGFCFAVVLNFASELELQINKNKALGVDQHCGTRVAVVEPDARGRDFPVER